MRTVPVLALLLACVPAQLYAGKSSPGLNGVEISSGVIVSRAILLLPEDRAQAGVIKFEIEGGSRPGVYQCEALGRGLTSREPHEGWPKGLIDGTTIYYAPQDQHDGATIPGVYDLRNIDPREYEIVFLGKPEDLKADADILPAADVSVKPHFTAVWRHWYSRVAAVKPVDMVWAKDMQAGSQGEGRPVLERKPEAATPEQKERQAAQLAHDPAYYTGPYGRSGFAIHTDRWEDAERLGDPKYAGRPELKDFRYRDTSGCVKLRPGCLAILNEFISEQRGLGRRVQLEVREVPGGGK